MTMRDSMAKAMRACRRSAGLTQAQLAQLSGVAESTIANWEQGFRGPTAEAAMLVCDVLGCSTDMYLGRKPILDGIIKVREKSQIPAKWCEIVCFARDPEAPDLLHPIMYLCPNCGRMQYEKTPACVCGLEMKE